MFAMKIFKVLISFSLFTIGISIGEAQPSRYALIIGVKSYQNVQPLQNTLNDAHDMATTLKGKGFELIELYDPKTKREMQDAIREYFKLLQGKPDAAGLLFYSGHGIQANGVNYLIPTQANPQIEADIDDQCLNMDYVMRAIEQAGNGLNIFVLDACRNNPFRGFNRTGEKGLSMVDAPKGSYIVYATKPGSVASDGTGRNGLFTSKLLKHLDTPELSIEQLFKNVAKDVAKASNDSQRPWIASDYTGDFFFTLGKDGTVVNNQEDYQLSENSEPATKEFNKVDLDIGYGVSNSSIVKIGDQEWLSKNLNVSRFVNGDEIFEAKTLEEWMKAGDKKLPAYCHYNNDPANGRIYGKLYNWYAVNDSRGLSPKGWHIPSDSEWVTITNFLGGEITAGLSIKSTNGWNQNGNGNNKSKFSGLPAGYRNPLGVFGKLSKKGYWWSSSEDDTDEAWSRLLGYGNRRLSKESSDQNSGYSVRCIRD